MRDDEQMRVHEGVIDQFIREYRNALPSRDRQTLFFFPGGMACDLWRSTKRFKDHGSNPSRFEYDKMWLRPSSLLWRARRLGMVREGQDLFRDKGNYIVIADGATNFNNYTPHDGLIHWCRGNNVDLFVFNWDWRRRQKDTSRFFVDRFWPVFKQRVKDAGIAEAAQNFSLLGHSFGGMIVNLILRDRKSEVSQKLRYAITAATPFYGYASQVHRWFEGETLLNGDGKQEWVDIIKVINSMPGLYVLHYLDYDYTYQRDRAALERDEFPLKAYPNVDAQTRAALDPWSQQNDQKGHVRYPEKTMGFDKAELAYALKVFQEMAEPIADQRFWNMRGVQVDRDGKPTYNTLSSVTCAWIREQFHPDDGCPVTNDKERVPGDGTQPAWTARLASNPQVVNVRHKDASHTCLMSNPRTLEELAKILRTPPPGPSYVAPPLGTASDDEYAKFRTWLKDYAQRRSAKEPTDEEILDAMPAEIRGNVPRIAARILEEILKRPDAMH